MIQRKQTIWLLIAALLCVGLFCFDLYRSHLLVNGVDTMVHLRVNDHYPSLIIAVVLVILPVITLFMFRTRKRQRSLAILNIFISIAFVALMLWRTEDFNKTYPTATNSAYYIGAVLPILAIIFLVMAITGINKDIKLVKSLDRLR